MAVKINGNDIVKAFTGGNSVKAIYSEGVKVWPVEPVLPEGYTRVNWIRGQKEVSSGGIVTNEPPVIAIYNLPFDVGDLMVEADIVTNSSYGTNYIFTSFQKESIFQSQRVDINNVHTNTQTDATYISDLYTTSNIGSGYRVDEYNQQIKIKQTIPHNQLNCQTWIDDVEYIDESYEKQDKTYTSFNLYILGSILSHCTHKLYGLKIKDSNDNILFNLIPAIRVDDGEVGLYDIVNDNFLEKHEPFFSGTTVLPFIYG